MKVIHSYVCFLLLVGYSQCIMGLGTLESMDRPKRCQLERIAKMIGYTCTAIDLRDVPQNLKTGVEVSYLVATTWSSATLAKCPSVRVEFP